MQELLDVLADEAEGQKHCWMHVQYAGTVGMPSGRFARSFVAISSTKRSTPQLSTSTSVWASTPEAPAFAFGFYRASRSAPAPISAASLRLRLSSSRLDDSVVRFGRDGGRPLCGGW
jgi:hypothetical protein